MRSLDATTGVQQFREERSRKLGAQREPIVDAEGLTSRGLVLGGVHHADEGERVLRLGHAVLVCLEEFSTRVREATGARALAESSVRVVATVVIADDDALGVAEYVDSDLTSARERELVGGEEAPDERPDERLRLLRCQLERRPVCVDEFLRTNCLVSANAAFVAPNVLSLPHWERLGCGDLYAAIDWQSLLRRTFDVDLRVCARCGGRTFVRAVVTEQHHIERILDRLRRQRDPPAAA